MLVAAGKSMHLQGASFLDGQYPLPEYLERAQARGAAVGSTKTVTLPPVTV